MTGDDVFADAPVFIKVGDPTQTVATHTCSDFITVLPHTRGVPESHHAKRLNEQLGPGTHVCTYLDSLEPHGALLSGPWW